MTIAESWDDLDVAMNGDDVDYDTEPTDLVDRLSIEIALARLGRVRRAEAVDVDVAESRIAQIAEWLTERREHHAKRAMWHENQLASAHAAILRDDPKAKTLSFPSGTLKAIAGRVSVIPEDEPAAIAWAQANGRDDLLNFKVTLSRTAVGKAFTAKTVLDAENMTEGVYVSDDGEIVPGVKFTKPGVTYKADPS